MAKLARRVSGFRPLARIRSLLTRVHFRVNTEDGKFQTSGEDSFPPDSHVCATRTEREERFQTSGEDSFPPDPPGSIDRLSQGILFQTSGEDSFPPDCRRHLV